MRSPGWQSSASHKAAKALNRIARAWPFFNIEALARVMPA
jgi:hypothetical protein